MPMTPNRRQILAGLAALAATPAAAEVPPLTSLRPRDRGGDFFRRTIPSGADLIDRVRLNGMVSYAVGRADGTGTLESGAGATGLPPASVAKALTATYALEVLGADHRFATRLMATGGIADGIVEGDLILAGSGDPTLDTNALADLAAAAKDAGVIEVRGGLKVWGGALPRIDRIDPGQPDHVGYSPAVSGLNLNFNRVHFEWRRTGDGYDVTMDARSNAYRPDVTMAAMQVVDRSMPVYTFEARPDLDAWTVARGALGSGGARWLPVRQPELYAGEVMQTMLSAQGIRVGAPERIETLPEDAEEVAAVRSQTMTVLVRDMLKYSTNITAEALGLAATRARGLEPETLEDSAAAMSTWASERWELEQTALVDHSGLGDRSRISARDMVRALRGAVEIQPLREVLKPVNVNHSVPGGMPETTVGVLAKTGTLNFVSGLAGFETLENGDELVFAIFAADLDRRAGIPREERERPPGASGWNGQAKALQRALLRRWALMYGEVRR